MNVDDLGDHGHRSTRHRLTGAPRTRGGAAVARARLRVVVADSDRILADALTPQAAILLAAMATARSGPWHPPRPRWSGWPVTAPPAPQIRATQRSPPGDTSPPGRWLGCELEHPR
ncbi:hypothetical protein [Rhodococcus koreensis]|uniref:hypothetical protein n=1 Tax=Rhodococcus koreensis TaxID=99653 RepID=UPI000A43A18D|nr:hypothetical protein [Rhodococcus koreensis]